MLVVGRSVVWERQVLETAEVVLFREEAVTIVEFDDDGLIRRYRSYYGKLAVMEQITAGMSGVYGWFAKKLVGYLVALGKKGLDTSSTWQPPSEGSGPAEGRVLPRSRPVASAAAVLAPGLR